MSESGKIYSSVLLNIKDCAINYLYYITITIGIVKVDCFSQVDVAATIFGINICYIFLEIHGFNLGFVQNYRSL